MLSERSQTQLYEISSTGKSMGRESRLVVERGWEEGHREGVVSGVQGFLLVWHKVNSFRTGYRWWLLNTMNVLCVTEMHILWKGYYFHVSPRVFKTPADRTQFPRARPCVAHCLCVHPWLGRHTQICLLAVLEHCQNVKSNTVMLKKRTDVSRW